MDNRANTHDSLFSRNSTPPTSPPQHPPFITSQIANNNSSPNLIDSLFQNLSAPAPVEHQVSVQVVTNPESHPADSYHDSSAATSTMSLPEDTAISPNTIAERQNSLLSLIGAPAAGRPLLVQQPPPPQQQPQQQQQQQQPQQQTQQQPPQQIPTPPGSSQRSNASPPQTDTQKMLEQMIGGGTSSRSTTYSDTQRSTGQQQPAPSPPFTQREDYRNFGQYDQGSDTSPRTRTIPNPHIPPPPPQPQQIPPPSPRRSMFEFTSAFDHLSSTATAVKKKPVPAAAQPSNGNEDTGAWTNPPDPKRQSVENLLENLTRGQPQASSQPQPPAYESYLSGNDFAQQLEQSPGRAPLPPIPSGKPTAIPNRTSSPRGSSPKNQTLHRPQPRAAEISISQQASYSTTSISFPPGLRHEKDGSPGPRGSGVRQSKQSPQVQPQPQPQPPKYPAIKTQESPAPQSQNIIFDVSQPLDEIQAREAVKWTPIALVKQDSVFLPGTTIGATHWVAYAMTRGRVRVISRSSGDRTLLQLPQVFSLTASVIDMAVFGNRLAGVTSDGGFVVWELPELITDDVPGRVLLCLPPTGDPHDAIRAVKWHPKEADILAIAADDKIYVIDLANTHALHGQPLPHSDLHHIGQLFNVHSPVVAFDFDVAHYALATISEDSTLTIWNMHDNMPYTVHKIRGDEVPSSLTFVDGGIVIGRRNGTVFQLLSSSSKNILSTISFVNGIQDDADMFGHITYDTRIQTLWVANSRRESLIALKLHIETSYSGGEETARGYIEQVAEFSGIKPTIHFVILTADADPHGDEAHAACVAAKIPPGELALVGFSVHSTGVDQVLIRKEWFDSALAHAESKFPFVDSQYQQLLENKIRQPVAALPQSGAQQPSVASFAPPRARTPTSDDVENEYSEGQRSTTDQKTKGAKNKNVNWKEESGKDKDNKAAKSTDAALISESSLGQALSREIKKTEESLHSRIGKLIGKEMDKQHQRFEETRLHEQAEDFARQEKILKLISTELTRNTTRVVEMAVKTEIQNSVLPSLENITRNEVKTSLNEHIGHGLVETINRSLPTEMEKLLLRPTISNHFANILSTALTPMIEHHIKEILTTTFFQFHSNQTAGMHQDLMHELRNELAVIKSELGKWQTESARAQEGNIRELEHTVRALSDQVKYLSINNQPPHIQQPSQPQQGSSAGPSVAQQQQQQQQQQQGNLNPPHLRQANIPPVNPPIPAYMHNHPSFPQQGPPPQQQQQQPAHIQQQQWYNPIAAPQASVPATLSQAPPVIPSQERTPPLKSDQWDESYLSVLHAQDSSKLRDLLARTNSELVFPLNGTPLVSQAVILTLIHRLSAVVGDTAPNDETFKTSLWWLQRVSSLLRPEDKLIADFIPRVIPTVQQSLNTTKQRLAILPGGLGTMETARALSDIQESLRRKIGQQ